MQVKAARQLEADKAPVPDEEMPRAIPQPEQQCLHMTEGVPHEGRGKRKRQFTEK